MQLSVIYRGQDVSTIYYYVLRGYVGVSENTPPCRGYVKGRAFSLIPTPEVLHQRSDWSAAAGQGWFGKQNLYRDRLTPERLGGSGQSVSDTGMPNKLINWIVILEWHQLELALKLK
jgi:hypothetical protein